MTRYLLVLLVLLGAGCATEPNDESAVAKNDAIDDYILVSELEEIDIIRNRGQLHHEVLTHKYIVLRDRRSAYLVIFSRKCRELDDVEVTPDLRYDNNTLRARFDTYRGCRIESLFELSEGQTAELIALGEKARE